MSPIKAQIRVASTGTRVAEIVDRVPITAQPRASNAVVMRLESGGDPDESLPDLRAGDLLQVSAELEVTTDLTPQELAKNQGKGCVSTPYAFAPDVRARLLLANDPDATTATGGAVRIGEPLEPRVTHDQHHWVLVFDRARLAVPAGWTGPSSVNLVLDASHGSAGAGHCLLVGQNEPDGTVERDMATLGVCRIRPANHTMPAWDREADRKARRLRIRKGENEPRVVYSMPLSGLKKNEQIRVHARVVVSTAKLGFKARLTTRVFLADSATQTEPDAGLAASIASAKGRISKPNGTNCLPNGKSPPAEKVGVVRMLGGAPAGKSLHVNVVATGGDPTKQAQPGTELEITNQGFLEVQRIPASAFG